MSLLLRECDRQGAILGCDSRRVIPLYIVRCLYIPLVNASVNLLHGHGHAPSNASQSPPSTDRRRDRTTALPAQTHLKTRARAPHHREKTSLCIPPGAYRHQ